MAAPASPGALPGVLAANKGIIDLDPWPAGAELVAAVPFDHRLHQFVLNPPGGIARSPAAGPTEVGQPFLAWASRCMARNHTRIGSSVPCRTVPAISDV